MKFPKTLYVKLEKPDSGPSYYNAQSQRIGLVEVGEEIQLGIYELVKTKTFHGVIEEIADK